MPPSPPRTPFWRAWLARPALPLGGAALLLLALAALPMARHGEPPPDPAADAAAVSRSLREQIDQPAVPLSANGAPELNTSASDDSPHGGRDLFAAAPPPRVTPPEPSPGEPSAAVPQGPSLPSLAGILVTGTQRQAVVDGQRVEIGDDVAGFRVEAIEVWGIRLTRGGTTYRLVLGEER